MTEKISNILFHPSKLIEYRNIKLYKALLYLFILALLSVLVPIIDITTFSGFVLGDKSSIESEYKVEFSVINDLPDCILDNGEFTCNTDEYVEVEEIILFYSDYKVIFDANDNYIIKDDNNYIILKKSNILIGNQYFKYPVFYRYLPKVWQSFDTSEMKNAENPETTFYNFIITGVNEINNLLIPFRVTVYIIFAYLEMIFQVLFYSLLFYIFYRRFNYKFSEFFKVTIFASTLATVLGLIFNLLAVGYDNLILLSTITFIYIYIAFVHNLTKKPQSNK